MGVVLRVTVDAQAARLPHEPDYIERTIATVRNHRDADNCWPQWANIFADQIEALMTDRAALAARLEAAETALRKAWRGELGRTEYLEAIGKPDPLGCAGCGHDHHTPGYCVMIGCSCGAAGRGEHG